MKREILFRGKRLNNGEWAKGYLTLRPMAICVGDYSPWYISVPPVDPDDDGGFYNIDPETVGQYTGLLDSNGRKIFEGDIVRAELIGGAYRGYSWGNQKVVFDRGAFCVEDRRGDTMPLRSYAPSVEIEVIGNVFDTPELLEAKE